MCTTPHLLAASRIATSSRFPQLTWRSDNKAVTTKTYACTTSHFQLTHSSTRLPPLPTSISKTLSSNRPTTCEPSPSSTTMSVSHYTVPIPESATICSDWPSLCEEVRKHWSHTCLSFAYGGHVIEDKGSIVLACTRELDAIITEKANEAEKVTFHDPKSDDVNLSNYTVTIPDSARVCSDFATLEAAALQRPHVPIVAKYGGFVMEENGEIVITCDEGMSAAMAANPELLAYIAEDVAELKRTEGADIDYTEAESELASLFKWYKVPYTHTPHPTQAHVEAATAGPVSKENATREIASAFSTTNARRRGGEASWPDQSAIFECFREMLDPIFGWLGDLHDPNEGLELDAKYFRPSYAAKYWLNRYLRLTQKRKLPRKESVSNVAVIHYRHEAKSDAGRGMAKDLEYIINSIQETNLLADLAGEKRFSHIILYGDFTSSTGSHLKNQIGSHFGTPEDDEKKVEVLYISRPWLPRGKESDELDEDEDDVSVRQLWAAFRKAKTLDTASDNSVIPSSHDRGSDPLPLQVKVLAIWTMLSKRYNPNVCVIGHRSGFVEGASFAGIPVFYLNNERPKGYEEPGDTLWQPVVGDRGENDLSRLQKIANVMNTLIPIYVLEKSTVDDQEEAALFMYMCCNRTEPHDGYNPGWTAKADFMNDHCQHPGSECLNITKFDDALAYLERQFMLAQSSESPATAQLHLENSQLLDRHSAWHIRRAKEVSEGFRKNRSDEKWRKVLREAFASEWNYHERQSGQEWLRRRYYFAKHALPLQKGQFELDLILQGLGPVLPTYAGHDQSIHHERYLDALGLVYRKCGPEPFCPVELAYDSHKSTILCIQRMSFVLCYDTYQIGSPNIHFQQSRRDMEAVASKEVQYACLHWTTHFMNERITQPSIVEMFMRQHFLHWVELMILFSRLPDVKPMLIDLQKALEMSPFLSYAHVPGSEAFGGLTLVEMVEKAKLFVLRNFNKIHNRPLATDELVTGEESELFQQGV
ncbi:hypothetical protein Q7P37_008265 [Cladosporium fusiforme]